MQSKNKWIFFIISMIFFFDVAILIDIPILRQLFVPLFLLFFPGLLIVQFLKLKTFRSSLQLILYSIGLSITFIMFVGWIINLLFPLFGIKNPISYVLILSVFNLTFIVMSILGYLINPSFPTIFFKKFQLKEFNLPIVLLSILIPILSILGMFLTNFYGINLILIIMILLISIIIVLATLEIIPKYHYPLIIFSISLALVFFGSLISYYIAGGWMDMGVEFYNYNLVIQNGYWDSSGPSNVNTMLSVTIFPAIVSILSGLSGEIVFRFLFPFIFAFVPLGLYETYRTQSSKKIAFLAVILFISMPAFFQMIPLLPRMCVSELFFAIIIMIIINEKVRHFKSSLLLILFAASLTVSHYGTAYFLIFFILMLFLIIFLLKNGVWNFFFDRDIIKNIGIHSLRDKIGFLDEKIKQNKTGMYVTWTFALFFIVFTMAWYIFVSSSFLFNDIVTIISNIYLSVFTDLFNVSARESTTLAAVGMGTTQSLSVWHFFNRIIWYFTEIFIFFGFFAILTKKYNFKFEFIVFSAISCILLALSIILPNFSENFSIYRIYHFSLFFLAPLCIVGGLSVFKWLYKSISNYTNLKRKPNYLNLVLVLLIPYLLFNIGLVFNYTDDVAPYNPLNVGQYQNSNDLDMQGTYLAFYIPKKDFFGAKWLADSRKNDSNIYLDYTSAKDLFMLYPIPYVQTNKLVIIRNETVISQIKNKQGYIFLREYNILNSKMITSKTSANKVNSVTYQYFDISKIVDVLNDKNVIYSNGADLIYS